MATQRRKGMRSRKGLLRAIYYCVFSDLYYTTVRRRLLPASNFSVALGYKCTGNFHMRPLTSVSTNS